MPPAPLPAAEQARLRALDRYEILDTLPEQAFDDMALLASTICDTPMATITLVDARRGWFKARIGVEITEAPREISFCGHAILDSELTLIHDARLDPRVCDNPFVVGEPMLRFYAAAPLITPDGFALGALCVADVVPRVLTGQQEMALRALARQIVVDLELRRTIHEKHHADRELTRFFDALCESESRVRSIIDNSPVGLITTDRDGAIESLNPAAERMFGCLAREVMGRPVGSLVQDGAGQRLDGSTFPCEVSRFTFEHGGAPRYATHVIDISERDSIDRLKSEFVAAVSHELRTPLTSIRGALGLLAAGVAGELPAEASELVTVAERNSTRLIDLINAILDFEKLDSGQAPMDFRPTSLARVMERSIEQVRAFAAQQRVRIEVDCGATLLRADESRLTQVMVNLLSNAVKFSPRGGVVSVTGAPHGSGWAEVRVRDRGQGIAPAAQPRLFQRFQQVESSDARSSGGAGLGLAICKSIVEQHGGTIGVQSGPGQGSTFWFRVPLAPGRITA